MPVSRSSQNPDKTCLLVSPEACETISCLNEMIPPDIMALRSSRRYNHMNGLDGASRGHDLPHFATKHCTQMWVFSLWFKNGNVTLPSYQLICGECAVTEFPAPLKGSL